MADLALFIKAIATRERDLDHARGMVNRLEHIDIIDIFSLINYSKGLGLNKEDFSRFLRDYAIPHTMDSLDSFYNYYSNNNKNDRYVYLIDLKIMLTPTVEHEKEFHITLNEGDELMTTNSMDCLKHFFELELNLFEKIARLALGFSQFDFDDVWRLFFAGSDFSGSIMEDYEFLSLNRLQLFMTEYGLEMSEFEWNMVMRRLLNNPKMTVREISKNEFKSFVKVFRSDYESNREEIIKDILNGAKLPLGSDVASSILFNKKRIAETTFSKHINFQANFNASSSNYMANGNSSHGNDSMSANMKSEEVQTQTNYVEREESKERMTKNTQTSNPNLMIEKIPNHQIEGGTSHNSYKLIYKSKEYQFNEEKHWSIIQKLKKEGIDVGEISDGMASEDVIRRIASSLGEVSEEEDGQDDSYVYDSDGRYHYSRMEDDGLGGRGDRKISVTHDYRVQNSDKKERNISIIKKTLEEYEGEYNSYYQESSPEASEGKESRKSGYEEGEKSDNFKLDFSKISIPHSRKGKFKHPKVIDPNGIFSSRNSRCGNKVSESMNQSKISKLTNSRKDNSLANNHTPVSKSFMYSENDSKVRKEKSKLWQNSYIQLESMNKKKNSVENPKDISSFKKKSIGSKNEKISMEFFGHKSLLESTDKKKNSYIGVSNGKMSRMSSEYFKEKEERYEPRKYLNKILCNNEDLINKISNKVMKNYKKSVSVRKHRIFKSSSHIRASRDNLSSFVNINSIVKQNRKTNERHQASGKKSRRGSASVKTFVKKIDVSSVDYVKMPNGAFKYVHENDETVLNYLDDYTNDNNSKISALESIVDLDSKLRNQIYFSSKPKSRGGNQYRKSLERKSLKQKKVSYFDQGRVERKRREIKRLMEKQHQSYVREVSKYVNSSFTQNGNSLLDRKSFESVQLKRLDDINRKLGKIANLGLMKERRSAQVPNLRSKIKEQYLNNFEEEMKKLRKSCDVNGRKVSLSKKLMKRKFDELQGKRRSTASRNSSINKSRKSSIKITPPDYINNNLSKDQNGVRKSSVSSLHERRARVKFSKMAEKRNTKLQVQKSRGSSTKSRDQPIQYWKFSEQRKEFVRDSHKGGKSRSLSKKKREGINLA